MPVDINRLTEGWLELESDPGLFTLLLEDFGVKGVQVEEIYDLQKSLEGPVYGFIFLFRWIEERRSRRKIVDQTESFVKDEEVVNSIFFAQQMVPNSCATHALISILLNCPNIHLGGTLSRLKAHTMGMCPENKGWAIGNTPELASAHNSHAMPQAKRRRDKTIGVSTGRSTGDAFHFVSYVPINGKLFELDGLKPYPMDHGPWGENEDWTEKFRKVIIDRLGMSAGEQYHDIRFNLMAVVPDRRLALSHKLKMLNTNRQIVSEALQQIMKLKKKVNRERLKTREKSSKPKDENEQDGSASEETAADNLAKSDLNGKLAGNGDVAESISSTPSLEGRENSIRLGGKARSDYSTPLTIQTSPSPSTASTDTSSEIGSAFNSPTQGWSWGSGQSSPNTGLATASAGLSPSGKSQSSLSGPRRFLVEPPFKKVCIDLDSPAGPTPSSVSCKPSPTSASSRQATQDNESQTEPSDVDKGSDTLCPTASSSDPEARQTPNLCCTTTRYTPEQFVSPHAFAPQDLLALLKNLEAEISVCQTSLRDENEKRKKYKVDDCRRTHNYDEFICTFLSMLAEQGKLADLVQQHQLRSSKKPQPIRLPPDTLCTHAQKVKKRLIKKPETKSGSSSVNKKKRGRSKRRK